MRGHRHQHLRQGPRLCEHRHGLRLGQRGSRYAHAQAFRTLTTVAEDGYIYETCLRTGTFLINWTVETLFNAKGSPALFKALEAEAAAAPSAPMASWSCRIGRVR